MRLNRKEIKETLKLADKELHRLNDCRVTTWRVLDKIDILLEKLKEK